MKEWKKAISDRIVEEAKGSKIVMLRSVARDMMGEKIVHIRRQDAMDIMLDAESRCSDMKLACTVNGGDDKISFFQTACLVDKSLEFEEGPEEY